MYDFFRGSVVSIDTAGNLALEVAGVGYSLRVSEQTRRRLPLDGSTVTVYARLAVREDDLQLYGFSEAAERAAFDLVTSVQGVGPAVGMALLSTYTVTELRQILLRKDATSLRKVKGVGTKSAERLVLELHDKVERIPAQRGELPEGERPRSAAADEARQALVALGFSHKDAIDALARVGGEGMDSEELVRRALAALRRAL